MKLFIHYEDNADEAVHKTSKVTLPKKWLDGPCTAVLELFVNSYNPKFAKQLVFAEVHLENDKVRCCASNELFRGALRRAVLCNKTT
jgi:hypothetical protein